MRIRVTSIGMSGELEVHEFPVQELEQYLRSLLLEFRREPQTRVYTCRGSRAWYELQWNDPHIPGECFLGSYGLSVARIASQAVAGLVEGGAVRLFVFNGDSELCRQEVLENCA
jgi:hypothetical protein